MGDVIDFVPPFGPPVDDDDEDSLMCFSEALIILKAGGRTAREQWTAGSYIVIHGGTLHSYGFEHFTMSADDILADDWFSLDGVSYE